MAANHKIISFNIRGLPSKLAELRQFTATHNPAIIGLSETLIMNPTGIRGLYNIPNYTAIRKDWVRGRGQGIAVFYRRNLRVEELQLPDLPFEAIAIRVYLENQPPLVIVQAYLSPHPIQLDPLLALLEQHPRILVMGDLNAKHSSWHCDQDNARGRALYQAEQEGLFTILAPSEPTHYPTPPATPSILDFGLAKGVPNILTPEVLTDMASDHYPISFTATSRLQQHNAHQAYAFIPEKWPAFMDRLTDQISLLRRPQSRADIDASVDCLTTIIQDALNATFRRRKSHIATTPLPPELRALLTERNRARRCYQRHPTPENRTAYNRATARARLAQRSHQSAEWSKTINHEGDHRQRLFRIARALKRRTEHTVPPLQTPTGTVDTEEAKADALAQSFPAPAPAQQPPAQHSEEVRDFLQQNPVAPLSVKLVTPREIRQAIQQTKVHKAPGEDGISNLVLRNLPIKAIILLTLIFNACLLIGYFPERWKTAKVLAFPKPGKPRNRPTSYRPISLLSCVSKIFERLILTRLLAYITDNGLIPPSQFGYTKQKSTAHQLHRVTHYVATGFNKKEFTAMAALDLSKAFDCLQHVALLKLMIADNFPPYLLHIIASYLSDRGYYVQVGQTRSAIHPLLTGVPQGSLLGPILFTYYLRDIPTPPRTLIAQYADDTALLCRSITQRLAVTYLQRALNAITEYFRGKYLLLNAQKTQLILFNPGGRLPAAYNITVDNTPCPWTRQLTYLGVVLDPGLHMHHQVQKVRRQATIATRMLYSLVGRRSPLLPDTKLLLYKVCIRPILAYCAPVYTSYISATSWNALQIIQNKSIKAAIGKKWSFHTDAAHVITNMPYLREYLTTQKEKYRLRLEANPHQECRELTFPQPPGRYRLPAT